MKTYAKLLFLIAITLSGCLIGNKSYIKSYPTGGKNDLETDTTVYSTSEIELYFGELKPDRPYIQVAYMESVGGKYSTMEELLLAMKKEAVALKSHAIIQIRKTQKEEEYGVLFADSENEKFQAEVYTGIAVRYLKKK